MSKPFLKWAGGKHKLAPFIAESLPNKNKRLIEPFVGSASVSLFLEFDEYYLNDSNADLINLYQILKQERHDFIEYAHSFFNDNNNTERKYYELRSLFNETNNVIEKSALFVYLNRHAFNGLCRYNKSGKFNVPFGRYKSPYFPKNEMINFIKKSDRMQFFCGDFALMFDKISSDDVIYCDPPYLPLSDTANFTDYAKNGFDLSDQNRLAILAQQKHTQTNRILISNHDTPLVYELYQGAKIKNILVQRNISAKGESRVKVGEILAIFNHNF